MATLIKASPEHKNVIHNLMQFYIYDFSEFLPLDVADVGLFSVYPYLNYYWQDDLHRFPFLIKADEKYAGLAPVRFIETAQRNYFAIAEFFTLKSSAWRVLEKR